MAKPAKAPKDENEATEQSVDTAVAVEETPEPVVEAISAPTLQPVSLGRAVHFVDPYTHKELSATVAEVNGDGSVHLVAFDLSQNPPIIARRYVYQDEEKKQPHTWHWPERV
jgi:hypothetical protein